MGFFLGCAGTWIFADAVISISLYYGKPGYNGEKQSWRRDHAIRVIRGILAVATIWAGCSLE